MAIENGVQNAELGYILDPAFQIENLNGKPVVGGYICVYEAGTDNKYISYENFDGAQNPFKIPLRADGRAVILGDPSLTYDVYFYDSYGNQLFSRLNVQCNVPGTINLSGVDTRIKNTDGTLDISLQTLGNNVRQYTVNTHNKRLDVQEPLYFVENSNTATVIGFSGDGYVSSSTYNTDITNINNNIITLSSDVTGKMDVDKLEFSNNKITGYDGSAFAGGGSVDPSEFVPWSASGAFQPSGNYYSASNPSGFINSDAISSMATTGFVADVSAEITALIPTAVTGDYLTKASADTLYYPLESNPSGYLTAHQDLSQYAKTEDLTAYQEKGNYYSASNPSGFLTKSSADELYAPTGDYATHDDLTAYQPSGNYADATALDGKVDTSSFTAFSSTTNEHIEYLSAALSGSYELSAGSGIDITDYPNEQKTVISVTAQGGDPEVEQVVREYSAAGTWLTAHQDISNLMPKSESANFYPMTGNPSGFLTAHQSLEGYATEQWVGEQGYLTEVPAGYATTEDVESATSGLQPSGDYYSASNPSGFITAVPAGTMNESNFGYDASDNITAYNGSAFNAGAGGLTVCAYSAISSDFDTFYNTIKDNPEQYAVSFTSGNSIRIAYFYLSGASITPDYSIPGLSSCNDWYTYRIDDDLETTSLGISHSYLTNGSITAREHLGAGISRSTVGAGGDVPEGVMVESAVEYNAVNEISGYNGSAIAQYGAEKQWLTHDDTIVHISNSAQYAFGVNLSGISADLARMMGVDETVLFETTGLAYDNTRNSITLSESCRNFYRIRLYLVNNDLATDIKEFDPSVSAQSITFEVNTISNEPKYYIKAAVWTIGDTAFNYRAQANYYINNGGTSLVNVSVNKSTCYVVPYKVIGIGRKS